MQRTRIAEIKPGMVLTFWHDTGAFGHNLQFARVEKVGRVMVCVRREGGEKDVWRHLEFFSDICDDQTVAELRQDGVGI